MPTTVQLVREHLGIAPARPTDEIALGQAVVTANDLVSALRADLCQEDSWAPRATYAATIQAARLYGRRSSVQGVAAFADVGVSLLPRLDPDVRSLLGLGEYQPSVTA